MQRLEIHPESVPYGPGPGAINGLNRDEIRSKITDICRSPAGLFYFGSLTPEGRYGNKGEVYYHDPVTGKTLNSFGLPNLSVDGAKDLMIFGQALADDSGKEFIVSVSAAPGEDPVAVLPVLAAKVLEAGVRRVEVNYSCPNKVADDGVSREPIFGYDIDGVMQAREAIFAAVGDEAYIIEKLPPYLAQDLSSSHFNEFIFLIGSLYKQFGKKVAALAISNTIPNVDLIQDDGRHALDIISTGPDGKEMHSHVGGMSGPYVAESMRLELEEFMWRTKWANVDLISAGGVNSGAEVLKRKQLGAVASVGVTAFLEGEKVGRTFGRTASLIAQEYFDFAV